MRGAPRSMTVLRPRSAAEAVALYGDRPQARPLAGGTDYMVLWNMGEGNGHTILDLSAVPEWRGIRKTATGVTIGALVTHAELQQDAGIRREFPFWPKARPW